MTGRPVPVRQALSLVDQLAVIVTYLHRQGVIHGNLKPSNVLMAANGIPRLADFRMTGGLFQGPLPADDQEVTGIGYLAPELAGDPTREPRPYTDIYGLGIILYELLTGRPPFAGAKTGDVLLQVRTHDPVPPSELNSEVTPAMERMCLRCLRKNHWQRYSRAYDLSRRLQHFIDDPHDLGKPGDRQPEL
jgi:serine/threonine protein kinase